MHLLGIRHHGPGSARSVRRALDELQPDAVLIELPADCQPLLRWAGSDDLRPPVALLGFVLDEPQRAVFSPFAVFSPEWVALRWAAQHGAPVHAIDLPLANSLAADDDDELALGDRPVDPLGELAAAAGDDDPERWWEDVVEHRGEGLAAFHAVAEAMTAVRGAWEATNAGEARREAAMRQAIRRVAAAGAANPVVVCGAWHVPALAEPLPPAAVDARTLRGLPKAKVGISWVPWTHRRLATASGYRSGVGSPGWYAHVYANHEQHVERWFVDAAHLLRARGNLVSPDHVIAAARGAAALAALRNRPHAGLSEMLDSASAVLADSGGMTLIHDQLVVGDHIGTVPEAAPQVPLARDLAANQRACRLKPQAAAHTVELDLRTPNGNRRSVLLHRLLALGVPWGAVQEGRGSSGTFRETWRLKWEPELEIRIIELAGFGTTVHAAAAARLIERLRSSAALADIVQVLDAALFADLPEVVAPAVQRLEQAAAHASDVGALIDALTPLATTLRYGDVRSTDAAAVRQVFDGLVVRVTAGAVGACRGLDDAAAQAMVERLSAAQAALAVVDHSSRRTSWPAALAVAAQRSDVHGLVQGRCVRLLHDAGAWDAGRVEARVSRALTAGTPPMTGAAFVEGFLAGSGTVLLHDRELLGLIDGWVGELAPDAFADTVALLRRTFGSFEPAERRQLGALIAARPHPAAAGFGDQVDAERAAAAMATVRALLGAPR
jgi:hypothetical protein